MKHRKRGCLRGILLLSILLSLSGCKKEELLTLNGDSGWGQGAEESVLSAESSSLETASKTNAGEAKNSAESRNSMETTSSGERAAAASGEDTREEENVGLSVSSQTSGQESRILYVYVCGAVERPGVYSFPEGARVFDAIAAAGGMTGLADETCVNQALLLSDQDQLYIRTKEERESGEEKSPAPDALSSITSQETEAPAAKGGRVNLNTASEEELQTLPGIGESKARAIAAYRQEHGSFAKAEDLMQVSGIGQATYAKLQEQITVQD